MLFNKRPKLDTAMDHFLHRDDLNRDERAVLDVYLTGALHALSGANAIQASNGRPALFDLNGKAALDARAVEELIGEFLDQRPDMKTQPLGLCAVMAVMQRFPA